MKKHYYDKNDKLVKVEEEEPVCMVNFCDSCGDCLHCYGADSCKDGGSHLWVAYSYEGAENA
jgi:hypothetical protein